THVVQGVRAPVVHTRRAVIVVERAIGGRQRLARAMQQYEQRGTTSMHAPIAGIERRSTVERIQRRVEMAELAQRLGASDVGARERRRKTPRLAEGVERV